MLKKITIITQDLLFSRFCYLCLKPRKNLFAFCRPCLKRLPYINHHCTKCGIELLTNQLCGQCLQKRNPINKTIPCFIYREQIKETILQLKFHQGTYLAKPLATLMHHKLRKYYLSNKAMPQALICVPLHTKKMRHRGYNQSYELSHHLCQIMQIQNMSHLVKKNKATVDQSSLALQDRKKNIKNVFNVIKSLPKHVAIIDDVMVTLP